MIRLLRALPLLILAAPVFPADTVDLDHFSSELRPLIERYTADQRSLNRFTRAVEPIAGQSAWHSRSVYVKEAI